MKNFPKKRYQTVTPQRSLFQLAPIAAGCAVLLMSSGLSYAQTAPEASSLNTVVVTGIRKGIEDAISVKKNSDSIVEAVSAEDIGKLPDSSIAESIARLPGLAAQRVAGRAQQISIRGMSPDFSTALLNGREQVSTGDSRYVEFDQYPSELLSGVTVYKTPDAGLVGQGLAGTIDMKTVRPLDFPSRAFAINARGEKLGEGLSTPGGSGNRFNMSYIDQFANRTLGLAVGYARLSETTGKTQNYGAWGTTNVTFKGASVTVPGGFNDLVDQTSQTRDAVMAVLEFKPNKDFSSTLDLFYTKFDQNLLEQGFQAPLAYGGGYGPATLTSAVIANGVATSGVFSNFKGVDRNDSTATHDKVTSIGWNNKLKMGEWTGIVDLATSEAKRKSANTQTTAGLAGNCATTPAACDTMTFSGFNGSNVGGATYLTGANYSNASVSKLTDVEGWGGGAALPQAGYSSQPLTDDKLNALRLSGKRNLPDGLFFSDLDLGFNYADRSKTRTYIEGRLVIPGSDPYAGVAITGGSAMNAPQSGIPVLAWNPDGSIGSIYQVAPKLVSDIANKNWKVSEKVTTAYGKLGIDNTLFGLPVRGNAGLQLIHTDQSSTAFNVDGSACPGDVCATKSSTDGATYYDVLPSANLAFDLGKEQTLRFGAGRQMARPTLNDMRASFQFSVDNTKGILTGSAGNPELKPFRANALDISYEKYFGNKAYVSIAGFYKQLDTYILQQGSSFSFSPYVTPGSTPLPTGGLTTGTLTHPINGSGGSLSGIELSASLPFNLVTQLLDGFGVQASFSNTDSSVSLPASGFSTANISTSKIPLPGLSKQVAGLTLYYEKSGFSARVGQRYRSDFVGGLTDYKGDNQLIYVKAERIVDLQLGYEFKTGPAKGLSVLVQGNNMTNAPFIQYQDVPSNEIQHIKYGKTYLFGLNYKY